MRATIRSITATRRHVQQGKMTGAIVGTKEHPDLLAETVLPVAYTTTTQVITTAYENAILEEVNRQMREHPKWDRVTVVIERMP